jgi:hypothetical protein
MAPPIPVPRSVSGTGNVVLDVAGQTKANAYALQKAGTPEEELVLLCVTPCAVTLKPGEYTLRFTSTKDAHLTSTGEVIVPPSGKILVRHMLGYEWRMPSGIGLAGLTLGGVGLVGTFIGVATAAGGSSGPGNNTQAVGTAMFLIGGAMFGGAVFLLHFGRGERQEGTTSVTTL